MPIDGYVVDAGLLVLLIVGRVGTEFIEKHRRLKGFDARAFQLLTDLLVPSAKIFVTPNTLTEASDLLRQHADPERSWFVAEMRVLVEESDELAVASVDAVAAEEYMLLGLTDAAILQASSERIPVLTTDALLYGAALDRGQADAVNFTHRLALG